jgi:hypothetical protein
LDQSKKVFIRRRFERFARSGARGAEEKSAPKAQKEKS